jgi:hypothetical protein
MAERESMFSRQGWLLLYRSGGLALQSHRKRMQRVNGGHKDGSSDLKEGHQKGGGDCEARAGCQSAKDIVPM